jgi:hypothetical protein
MPLSENARYSQLSPSRRGLVRLCQSINYGHLQELVVADREPILKPPPVVFVDVKLDTDESPRTERESADFVLCAEAVRLMGLLDRIKNGKISKLEVRAGIPRRIVYEQRISDFGRVSS